MTTEVGPPSPMTKRRLRVMQDRLSRNEPLATLDDQPQVSQSIQRRYTARARVLGLGGKPPARDKESRFDEDGEPLDDRNEFDAVDRYLATRPGTEAAAHALRIWKMQRGHQ